MTREQYIVRNCPAFNPQAYEHCCNLDGNYKCEYCTDCVIKQVIEVCKEEHERGADYMFWVDKFAQEILELFDIEEIRE